MGSGVPMAKPRWLIDIENKENGIGRKDPHTCGECRFRGKPIGTVRYGSKKKWTNLYECAIHPGCRNTQFSVQCGDWEQAELL
jgi:hypothetical protein